MTTNQPQPGSELDERLAKALGWERAPDGKGWDDPEGVVNNMDVQYPNEYGEFCRVPPFSTDTATAMATLEQLCKPKKEGGRGWEFDMEYRSKYKKVWLRTRGGITIGHRKSKTSFAHAASLAMLAALEAEK